MVVREIDADELDRLVEVVRAIQPDEGHTVGGFADWRRQASDMVWLLCEDAGRVVGAGIGVIGWHTRPGIARVEAWTLPAERGRGAGVALYRALAGWALARGCIELQTVVAEDDEASIRWAERHGFREIGRNRRRVLDLTAIAEPAVDPPAGIRVVPWSELEGVDEGLYAVYREAEPDIPGEQGNVLPDLAEWLSDDMEGAFDRRDAVFVALAGDQVVGYAKLSIPPEGGDLAFHDLVGVLRDWRGRGIAGALKRAQIAWARAHGFRRLATTNEERNEPMQRLNERLGYVVEPGSITLHTMLDAAE
jgi:RimJ/RimL family protein N-acetyltransferase